jgi:hypothetical protein
VGVGNQK